MLCRKEVNIWGSTTFGEKIKLEGEREYRQALSQINSDLKVFSSELGKLTAEFGKNDKSTQGLTERNKVLTEQIEKPKRENIHVKRRGGRFCGKVWRTL